MLTLRRVTNKYALQSWRKIPPPSLLLVCAHTDILVSLPHTDILVSLGVTVSGAPDSGGAQTGGRGKSADVARQGTRGERQGSQRRG